MYCVRLKPTHRLAQEDVDVIKGMELSTPEERYRSDSRTGEVFEVYFEGAASECREFIQKIGGDELRRQFEIF